MPKKQFVLDTNVLLHDCNSLQAFGGQGNEDNEVIIPLPVLEEIDRFKEQQGSSLGYNAREILRQIEDLRSKGSLVSGVPLPGGGILRVAHTSRKLPADISTDNQMMDNRIMAVALEVQHTSDLPTIMVTKDMNFRIRAEIAGLTAEDYATDAVKGDALNYTGWQSIEVDAEVVDALFEEGALDVDDIELMPHECVLLVDPAQKKHSAVGKADKTGKTIHSAHSITAWGVRGRNLEQHFALALLMDPTVQLVTLVGKAGTGKTLLALAAALEQTANQKEYHKTLVTRPIIPMGRDLGYLPGTVEEKMDPWMRPIHDNLEFLAGGRKEDLFSLDAVEVEPLTYIRGRSIPNRFIIIDESQNLTPLEVRTIVTRAGVGTKLVFTGDPDQIDNPYVDIHSNGLSYLVSRFMGDPLFGHIQLVKGERSELAETAARRL